jgi:hypothetical protein
MIKLKDSNNNNVTCVNTIKCQKCQNLATLLSKFTSLKYWQPSVFMHPVRKHCT